MPLYFAGPVGRHHHEKFSTFPFRSPRHNKTPLVLFSVFSCPATSEGAIAGVTSPHELAPSGEGNFFLTLGGEMPS